MAMEYPSPGRDPISCDEDLTFNTQRRVATVKKIHPPGVVLLEDGSHRHPTVLDCNITSKAIAVIAVRCTKHRGLITGSGIAAVEHIRLSLPDIGATSLSEAPITTVSPRRHRDPKAVACGSIGGHHGGDLEAVSRV